MYTSENFKGTNRISGPKSLIFVSYLIYYIKKLFWYIEYWDIK